MNEGLRTLTLSLLVVEKLDAKIIAIFESFVYRIADN
jgi:hypothetical protein